MNKLTIIRLLMTLILVLGTSAMAWAQLALWTAVGSDGTPDDLDAAMFDTAGSAVQVKSGAPLPATLDVRYNVVAVQGVFSPGDGVRLTARFRDNGGSARVLVRLFQVNFATGTATLRLTVDSNVFPPGAGYQTQSEATCSGNFFNFLDNAYYVHVTLAKSAAAGNPGLQLLQISGALC